MPSMSSKTDPQVLLDEAAEDIKKGDKSFAEAKKKILAAKAIDPDLTNEQVGKKVGKSGTWVGTLLKWDESTEASPHSKSVAGRNLRGAKTVINNRPDERKKLIAELDPEVKQELAKELLADPNVARGAMSDPATRVRTQQASGEMRPAPVQPPVHQQKAAEAADSLKEGVGKALTSLMSPLTYIESANDTMDRIDDAGGEISNFPECMEAYKQLGGKLWQYGALRGVDVSEINTILAEENLGD